MVGLSGRIGRLRESATLRMARLARTLRGEGKEILDLSLGEPDFPTPAHIQEAMWGALAEGYTHYPPVAGFGDLREAIAEYTFRQTGRVTKVEEVLVSAGAKQALSHLLFVLADEGDEVLIPAPYWVSYADMAEALGLRPVVLPTRVEEGYRLRPEVLERGLAEHPRARILILNSPCNPTGVVYGEEDWRALSEVLARYPELWVVSDEVYDRLVYSPYRFVSPYRYVPDSERCIIVNSCSKTYAMTGWRVGWLVAPAEVVRACERLQGQTTAGACSLSQRAALRALTGPQDCVERMREAFGRRLRIAVESLGVLLPWVEPVEPSGTFYLWVEASRLLGALGARGHRVRSGEDLAVYLLETVQVAVVGGDAFGDPMCFRISCAVDEERLRVALNRLVEGLSRLIEVVEG